METIVILSKQRARQVCRTLLANNRKKLYKHRYRRFTCEYKNKKVTIGYCLDICPKLKQCMCVFHYVM